MRWNVSWIKLTANETHIHINKKKSCHPIIRFNRLIVNILHFLRFNVFSSLFFSLYHRKRSTSIRRGFPIRINSNWWNKKLPSSKLSYGLFPRFFFFFFFFFNVGSDRLVDTWSRPSGREHASSVWQIVRLIV